MTKTEDQEISGGGGGGVANTSTSNAQTRGKLQEFDKLTFVSNDLWTLVFMMETLMKIRIFMIMHTKILVMMSIFITMT